jgi:hypothetical protein
MLTTDYFMKYSLDSNFAVNIILRAVQAFFRTFKGHANLLQIIQHTR